MAARKPAELVEDETILDNEMLEETQDETPVGSEEYVIEPGDTLQSIALAHGYSADDTEAWKEIFELNAEVIGTNPNILPVGETIVIPGDE